MKKAKLKRLVTILISVSLITSFAVGCNMKGNSQQSISINNEAEEKSLKEFIENNHADIDINNNDIIKDLSILDEDAENYEIFLTGEGHAIKKNLDLKLALLKYFNKKAGVTYL